MVESLLVAAVIVLSFALGALTTWLTTRGYYKNREREELLHDMFRIHALGGRDPGPYRRP